MSEQFDFAVMGAGVMGLCSALALHQRGYSVLLLEAGDLDNEPNNSLSRLYALNLASQHVLQDIGVWDQVHLQSAAYERMHVWDAQSSAQITFDSRMLARDRLGVMVEEHVLKRTLLQKVRSLNIAISTQWRMENLQTLDDKIVLSSKQENWEASFLLVTDGARSSTRDLLKIPLTTWSYDQHALVANVKVAQPHARTAYQVFCEQGPLAFLPMTAPHHCSIVWSSAIPHIKTLMALPKDEFAQKLAQAFEYKLGEVELLSERKSYPLQMQHVQEYVGKRWVILGDAAHTIHPMAGLGLNLGLADLTALLEVLTKPSLGILTPRALRAYQRHRKHELWQMILFLQGMHGLFMGTHLPIKLIRRLGLNVCNRLPMLKRFLMEQAAGVSI
ncbi:MAG: FAD-dependent oxidoreductase [Gammaproteobacteria bacterium]